MEGKNGRPTEYERVVLLPGLGPKKPRIDRSKAFFKLEIRRSKIHRWGVFALEDIPARRRVIEYTGQKIDSDEVERRIVRKHMYIFWLNDKWAIDGAIKGSGAELINHSCDGNLESWVVKGRIYLSTRRRVLAGEELTYDYNMEGEDAPDDACRCGSKNCRGKLAKKLS
jgi:SET domain-containing protein